MSGFEKKKLYLLFLLPLIGIFYMSLASAVLSVQHSQQDCYNHFSSENGKYDNGYNDCLNSMTTVSGKITEGTNPLGGASVTVTCVYTFTTTDGRGHHKTTTTTTSTSTKTTISSSKRDTGYYKVTFPDKVCDDRATVTVTATTGSQTGTNSGTITDKTHIKFLDFAVINVSLIPEFGFFAGSLTLLGALGLFLVIRKK